MAAFPAVTRGAAVLVRFPFSDLSSTKLRPAECSLIRLRVHLVRRSPPLNAVSLDIETALSTMRRSANMSDTWRPMHGDLTPWNLRRLRDGRLTLLDWEDASWGPDGADEVLYRATEAALSGRKASPSRATEAIGFWRTLFTERPNETKRDR